MELWSKLRNLDAYPKVNEDFYSRTLSGGLITLVSSLAILLLFFSEIPAIREDDSPDLREVGRILEEHLKIPDVPLKTRRLVQRVRDIVTRRNVCDVYMSPMK